MNIQSLKTTTDGIWADCGDGLRVKVFRMNNQKYTSMIRKLSKPLQRQLRTQQLDYDKLEDIAMQATAKHVLCDWENLTQDGVQIPFSSAKALELFREFPDLYTIVVEAASDFDLFRVEEDEDSAKNSESVSSGPLNGESSSGT